MKAEQTSAHTTDAKVEDAATTHVNQGGTTGVLADRISQLGGGVV